MVYNPVEADRRGAVTLRLDDVSSSYVRVYDEKGREIKSQVTPLENGVLELVLLPMLKALAQGYMMFARVTGLAALKVKFQSIPITQWKIKSILLLSTERVIYHQFLIKT